MFYFVHDEPYLSLSAFQTFLPRSPQEQTEKAQINKVDNRGATRVNIFHPSRFKGEGDGDYNFCLLK